MLKHRAPSPIKRNLCADSARLHRLIIMRVAESERKGRRSSAEVSRPMIIRVGAFLALN